MREKREYILIGNEEDVRNVRRQVNLGINCETHFIEVYTDTNDFRLLQEASKDNNVSLHLSKFEMEYTKSELDNSKYFVLRINSYCSEFAEKYGTRYSYEDKCKCCGSGKKQVSDLFIDKTKVGKKDISATYGLEIVISEKLYNLLLHYNITGLSFRDVHHKNNNLKSEPVLYQLFCTNTLRPLNEQTVFYKEKYCECCCRSGLHVKSLPYYDEEDLKDAKDFNYTFEYFGSGWSGTPDIIVSRKVYKLFRDNKIKGVSFDIVKIV